MAKQTKYLSQFLAARYVGIRKEELQKLIKQGDIPVHKVDRFDPKIAVRDLDLLIKERQHIAKQYYNEIADKETTDLLSQKNKSEYFPSFTDIGIEKIDGFVGLPLSVVIYCDQIPLFVRNSRGDFDIYKKSDESISEESISDQNVQIVYTNTANAATAVCSIHQGLRYKLAGNLMARKFGVARDILEIIFSTTISTPNIDTINSMISTFETFIKSGVDNPLVLYNTAQNPGATYSVVVHSLNVFIATLIFCIQNNYPSHQTFDLSIAALLHDIGVSHLLTNRHKADENNNIEAHVKEGYTIVRSCQFDNEYIIQAILEHHERLDGTGYPNGIKQSSLAGQLIALIDTYELYFQKSLLLDYTPKPYDILQQIKNEVYTGRFNAELFRQLVFSKAST